MVLSHTIEPVGVGCPLNDQNKGLSAGDGDIPRIACASDQSEFAVIGDTTIEPTTPAIPLKREQVAHTGYPRIHQR